MQWQSAVIVINLSLFVACAEGNAIGTESTTEGAQTPVAESFVVTEADSPQTSTGMIPGPGRRFPYAKPQNHG